MRLEVSSRMICVLGWVGIGWERRRSSLVSPCPENRLIVSGRTIRSQEEGAAWPSHGSLQASCYSPSSSTTLRSTPCSRLLAASPARSVAVVAPGAVAVQVIAAVLVAAAGIVLVRPRVSAALAARHGGHRTRGVHGGLVGQEVITLDLVGGLDAVGHVNLAGERWRAVSGAEVPLPAGTRVLITGVEGTTLIVWPARRALALRGSRGPGTGSARRRTKGGAAVIVGISMGGVIGLALAVLVMVVLILALRQMVNIVQQGEVGVVKHLGEYRKTHEPGLVIIKPFVDSLQRVDMREIPRPGDRQDVITKDNVVVTVNATIFTQVVVAEQALFSIANFDVGIDALARTALRSVIGTMTLDQALSERENINTDVQQQMEAVTDKWGIRINRIEIIEIAPPPKILEALALQKQADQEKRATILQSEGHQQSAINVAEGAAQAAVRQAEGERQAAILRAEGSRQAAILESEGRAQAIETVYAAIKKGDPDPTLVAILQLDALAKFADSDNAKIVVPFESAGLLGAAQTLRSVLAAAPADGELP